MKPIFNKIKEHWAKYFIEAFVIVIGILGAFAIESWAEGRKENEDEQRLLTQLKDEYQKNLSQLDLKIKSRENLIRSAEILLDVIDGKIIFSSDSFNILLSRTFVTPTFNPFRNDLAISGKLYIIDNEELRVLLTQWSANIHDVIELEINWKEFRDQQYFPYLIEHYSMRTLMSLVWSDFDFNTGVLIEEQEENYPHFEISKAAISPEKLLNDGYLEDYLATAMTINYLANMQAGAVRKNILDILELVNMELE